MTRFVDLGRVAEGGGTFIEWRVEPSPECTLDEILDHLSGHDPEEIIVAAVYTQNGPQLLVMVDVTP